MQSLIVIGFGLIQLVLVGRIAIDLGFLSSEGNVADFVISASEALAAPVQAVSDAMGIHLVGVPGAGIDAAILAALLVWSLVEGILLMLFGRIGRT
jgi:hypothetical protein